MSRAPLLLVLTLLACGEKEDPSQLDVDGDGYKASKDCDDEDPTTFPEAEEVCDGGDNDCDGQVDEGVTTLYFTDTDGDGYGVATASRAGCEAPEGFAPNADDCNDADATIHPDAAETCNGIDDNCDGVSDDGATYVWYADADGDGYGDPATEVTDCNAPAGYINDGTDCDDTDPGVHPDAEEVCDLDDDNCDGRADQGTTATWYEDADGDGYGHPARYETTCDPEPGWVQVGGDCAYTDATIFPGAPEACNSVDDDCDGTADEDFDQDADGYWSAECTYGDDCDDLDDAIHPLATETCDDGIDDDCDGKDTACGFDGTYSLKDANSKMWAPSASFDAGRLIEIGDANGDSIDDVLVATLYAGGTNGGGYIVYGPISGDMDLDTGGFRMVGSRDTYGAGRSIGMADANGDGMDDILFGSPYTANSGYLLYGPVTATTNVADADVAFVGHSGSYCGHGSDVGDVNGDGLADGLFGAYAEAGSAGRIYVKFAPFSADEDLTTDADATLDGENRNAYTGRVVRGGQDMNGDGIGDLLIPAVYDSSAGPNSGSVYVEFGPPSGAMDLASADGKMTGEASGDSAGFHEALGDVNGDGLSDAIIGAPGHAAAGAGGATYVVFGPATGTISLASSNVLLYGAARSEYMGGGVASNDINGDGFAEVFTGAPSNGTAGASAGAAYLFLGPLTGTFSSTDAVATVTGEAANDCAGQGVGLGDVDGDGWGDLVLGAPGERTGGSGAGAMYVLYAEH